jgi:hypothetical protein
MFQVLRQIVAASERKLHCRIDNKGVDGGWQPLFENSQQPKLSDD